MPAKAPGQGKRRTGLKDHQERKLVGVVELTGSAEDVDRAAAHLLNQLQEGTAKLDRAGLTSQGKPGAQLTLFQEEMYHGQ